MKKNLKIVGIILGTLALVGEYFFFKSLSLPVLTLLILCVALYLISSIRIIRGDQMALILRFGKPVRLGESGLRIIWKFIEEAVIYSKKAHILSYPSPGEALIPMVTKKGTWGGERLEEYEKFLAELETLEEKEKLGELTEKEKKELEEKRKIKEEEKRKYKETAEEYDSVVIYVGVTLVFWWPRTFENLKKAFENLPMPGDPADPHYIKRIKSEFEDLIVGNMREIVGNCTWEECIRRREILSKELLKRLSAKDSPFKKGGVEDFYLTISEIKLPPEIERLLSIKQQESFKRAAAEEVAQRVTKEIGNSISQITKVLEKAGFPREVAQQIAHERFRDLLSAREGELHTIHIITKGEEEISTLVGGIVAGIERLRKGKKEKRRKEKIEEIDEEEFWKKIKEYLEKE